MKFAKKMYFGKGILLVILIGISGVVGCGGKKKQNALWPLALMGSGTSQANTESDESGSNSNTAINTVVSTPNGLSLPSNMNLIGNGLEVNLVPTVDGGGITFTISPTLPSGLSLNPSTGAITGSYLGFSGVTSNYTLTATNSLGSMDYPFTLTVFGKAPTKTGITQCWGDFSIDPIPCSGAGEDGDSQSGTNPNFTGPSLVGANDYITLDNNTGLTWKTCVEGLSGASCQTGSRNRVNLWSDAMNACSALNSVNSGAGYANRNDWRLPTVQELNSIINYGVRRPTTFTSFFPGTGDSLYYWSSSLSMTSSNRWATIDAQDFEIEAVNSSSYNLRCVSGNSVGNSFIDNNNGTITDLNTGLLWQKCTNGLSGSNCEVGSISTQIWLNAMSTCKSLSLGGKGAGQWRLPSIRELKNIIDRTKSNPAIDPSFFPATFSGYYLTSTTDSSDLGNEQRMLSVHFRTGSTGNVRMKYANADPFCCVANAF